MTALVVPDDGPLSDADVDEMVGKLRQAAEWVCTANAPEATDTMQKARLVREWVKISNAAKQIGIEAVRLHFTALRRLAQLNACDQIASPQERSAARWLADMTDSDFATLLDEKVTDKSSPTAIYREMRAGQQTEIKVSYGRELARGSGVDYSRAELAYAASQVLNSAMASGQTTVSKLTENLVQNLELAGDSGVADSAIREGVENIVREAIRIESRTTDGRVSVIVFKTKEGWLRIPWNAATLEQLKWMADFRMRQAQELTQAAEELASLTATMEKVHAENPTWTTLKDLWAIHTRNQSG
jgi:hypothetical protein